MIEQLKRTQEILAKIAALLQADEADTFAAHLYQSRRQYRCTGNRPFKSKNAIRRIVLSTYQVAHSLGFNGHFSHLGALAAG